ncbi:PAS-domain containing protein [Arenibacterium sp. CAU 1754]
MAIYEWSILAVTCLFTAGIAVYWLAPRAAAGSNNPRRISRSAVWLFDGEDVMDATTNARPALNNRPVYDWQGLSNALSGRFSGFPRTQDSVRQKGPIVLAADNPDDPGQLTCEWLDGVVRVELLGEPIGTGDTVTNSTISTLRRGLDTLQSAVNQTPYPIWRVGASGKVIWCNAAYGDLCRKLGYPVEDRHNSLFTISPDDPGQDGKRRMSVSDQGSGRKLWFDVSVVRHEQNCLCYAVDVNAVVEAEVAQRNFVQTLAKTFAQLSIGLAIFDRNRQLALFNPALIDLTALPADFLSARPNLLSFFDRMRDQRMMPEPKNYNSWRHQMAELVEAASDGRYQETWSLASGSVYSVTGRPHPDGAIAFLIEDITAEITLTRRFRSDLELSQSILDQLDDAIAVFASDGSLTVTNAAYRDMWSVDPDNSFAQTTALDATRSWQDQCKATPVWGEIRDFVAARENRAEWWADVRLKSGTPLLCTVSPIQNGATMVVFGHAPNGERQEPRVEVSETT